MFDPNEILFIYNKCGWSYNKKKPLVRKAFLNKGKRA